MRRPIDSQNKCTKYLQKLLGDIAILAICKYWSIHIIKTNTLMLFKFVLNYQPMRGECGIV